MSEDTFDLQKLLEGGKTPARREGEELTPRQIVEELDRYIIGQADAKRAVAIALRNRMRRRKVAEDLREEIVPKNILMIGPTGVGKTEIARRLAKLANAPFIKVEATKFTEVGYVGRDVDSMIRDLADQAYAMVQEEAMQAVWAEAQRRAEDRLAAMLVGEAPDAGGSGGPMGALFGMTPTAQDVEAQRTARADWERRRDAVKYELQSGRLEDREIEVEVEEQAMQNLQIFSQAGLEEMGINMKDMLGSLFPGKKSARRMKVGEARDLVTRQEAEKLVDGGSVSREAVRRAEESGIVFVDELDKIAGREGGGVGPDVSREGVQRDILPIIEGSTVVTKHGPVRTDHILFIAAGAFHVTSPSDLIPELQGRLPIRVKLHSLGMADFARILVEPENSLVRQYTALLGTEAVEIEFTDEAIGEIARLAQEINEQDENIGARRLYTMMERVLEELSFYAPEIGGHKVAINGEYVRKQVAAILKDRDLSRHML
jgi:ATP-dependent HslUV protease ATP-binding subunit HslU